MKLCTTLVPLLVFGLMTICDGLPNQFLNQFSCEDHSLDCNAEIEAGQPLSNLCTDLSLELSQTSADFGLLLYYQVKVLCLSDHNNKGTNMNNRTMEYDWHQNKDYVG